MLWNAEMANALIGDSVPPASIVLARPARINSKASPMAFVPLARYPVYCASKAFVHSFSISLRHQLKETGVRVVELAPPWVESGLHDAHPPEGNPEPAPGRGPMPLEAFLAAAMTLHGGQYAIHGTNVPNSIGGFVSYGCIRMYNQDIVDLYERVGVGTTVVVTR